MRDKCKGNAAYLQFLRAILVTAEDKKVDVGKSCPFFQTKGGCPFAKDASEKPVLSPDFIVVCFVLFSSRLLRRIFYLFFFLNT